jgi:hypothetical protein
MKLGCYGFTLGFIESPERLLDRPCFRVHIECVLNKFPGNSWHVSWTPGEDFPALTEEVDECSFLCGGKVRSDRGGFLQVSWGNPNLFRVTRRIESLTYVR